MIDRAEVPHADDMTVRNFYKHMGKRHPMEGFDWETHSDMNPRDNGAYRATIAYHERLHKLEVGQQFDHDHREAELTCE